MLEDLADKLKQEAGGAIGGLATSVHDVGHLVSSGIHDLAIGSNPQPTQQQPQAPHIQQPVAPHVGLGASPAIQQQPQNRLAQNVAPQQNNPLATGSLPAPLKVQPNQSTGSVGSIYSNLTNPNQPKNANPVTTSAQHSPGLLTQARHLGGDVVHGAEGMAVNTARLPVQFAENYANTFANLGRKAAGAPQQTIQQNLGGNAPLNNTLRFSQATGQNKQLASDVGQIGLMAATPGADRLAVGAVNRVAGQFLPDIASRVIGHAATGSLGGSAFNVASLAGSNAPLTAHNVGVAAGQGALLGGALGAGSEGLGALPDIAGNFKGNLVRMNQQLGEGGFLGLGSAADTQAERATGLSARNMVNDNEAGTLSDWADYQMGRYKPDAGTINQLAMQARNAADTAGIDVINGSPADINSRIADYLEQRDNYISARNHVLQGGYVQLPRGKPEEPAPEQQATPAQATPEEIGRALGMSDEQIAEASREPELPAPEVVNDRFAPENNPQHLTPEDRRQIIEQNPNQQTVNKVDIGEPKTPQAAIARAEGVEAERQSRFAKAEHLANKLDEHDQALLSERADPNTVVKPHDQAAFDQAAAAIDDAYDYHLATDRAAGGTTLRFGNGKYAPLYLQATPEEMDALDIPEEQRVFSGKYSGFRDATRKYRSYQDAASHGLKPLFKSPVEDMRQYAENSHVPVRNALLKSALQKSNPHDIAELGMGIDASGKPFRQAAGANLPFNASESIDKYLKNYRRGLEPTSAAGQTALKAVKKTGSITKKSLFLGSPFHQVHITENVGFASLLGGEPGAFGEGLMNAAKSGAGLSKDAYFKVLDHYRKDGSLDYARNMGIQLEGSSPLGRVIDSYALALAKAAKNGGIEEGSQEAIDLGAIYNRLLGRVNAPVEGVNRTLEQLTSYFSLAPHYMRTQLRLVWDAVAPKRLGGAGYDTAFKLTTPGGAARSAVIGPRVLGALTAVTAGAIIMHRFPTWQQAVNEMGLNPNNTNPNIPIKSRNPKGESQVMNLPTDPLGLAFGLITDPQHFFQSRESPALSMATKIATNKNWNGNQLVDTNKPGQFPLRVLRAAENSVVPIGVQNFTNLQHNPNNPNIEQGVAQELGLRLKTNPNDPQVKANNAYFKALGQVTNELKGSGPYGQYWAQQFANLHPANTTDANGMKYPTPYEPLSSEQKYAAYVDSSSGKPQLSPVFYADKKLSTVTPGYPTQPLYQLNGNGTAADGSQQPKALIALEYQHAQDPAAKANILNANGGQSGWISKYESDTAIYSQNYQADLTGYFKSLGWTPTAINTYWQNHPSTPDPVAAPVFDQKTNDLMSQYYTLSAGGDSTAASQFFSQNAGLLGPAMDQLAQHANALRQAKGELQLQGYPAESARVQQILGSMPSGSDSASKKARAQLIQANPDVNQYLANIALYEALDKGSQFRYINPANPSATEGQNINAGGKAGQTFLKDVTSLGKYDIGYNPSSQQYSFVQNGSLPAGSSASGSSSGSGGSKKPLVAMPKIKYVKALKTGKPRKPRKIYAKVKKSSNIHRQEVGMKNGSPLKAGSPIKLASA